MKDKKDKKQKSKEAEPAEGKASLHKEAQAFYESLRAKYVPKGLQRIPGRLVPQYIEAIFLALKRGRDAQKASDAFWSERGYVMVRKKDAEKQAGKVMKNAKPGKSNKDSVKKEKADKKSGKQKNKKKDKAKAKKSSKSSDDGDGGGPGPRPHLVTDVLASFGVTPQTSANDLKSLLRDIKAAGVSRVTDDVTGKVYRMSYDGETPAKVLAKRVRVALRVLHTEETLNDIDNIDTEKLKGSCFGHLYDMAQQSPCVDCPDKTNCRKQYISNIVSNKFKSLRAEESGSAGGKVYVVTYTTNKNPYTKKDKPIYKLCERLLRKKPKLLSSLRKMAAKFYKFKDEAAFADLLQKLPCKVQEKVTP